MAELRGKQVETDLYSLLSKEESYSNTHATFLDASEVEGTTSY